LRAADFFAALDAAGNITGDKQCPAMRLARKTGLKKQKNRFHNTVVKHDDKGRTIYCTPQSLHSYIFNVMG
jgi:hypothetical protein